MAEPLATLGILLNETWFSGDCLTGWLSISGLLYLGGVSSDGNVGLGVKFLEILDLSGSQGLFPVGELSLEDVGITLLE